jgi:hypothetical protein
MGWGVNLTNGNQLIALRKGRGLYSQFNDPVTGQRHVSARVGLARLRVSATLELS